MKQSSRRSQDHVVTGKCVSAKESKEVLQQQDGMSGAKGKDVHVSLPLKLPSTRSFSSSVGSGPYLLPKSLVDQYPLYPLVLVQLPMYNEEAHCEVVIERACRMEWPRDRVIIQARTSVHLIQGKHRHTMLVESHKSDWQRNLWHASASSC
jgi:hypothetical protein